MMKWILFIPELYYLLVAAIFFLWSLRKDQDERALYARAVILSGLGVLVTVPVPVPFRLTPR